MGRRMTRRISRWMARLIGRLKLSIFFESFDSFFDDRGLTIRHDVQLDEPVRRVLLNRLDEFAPE